jgi:hypothetical protein
LGEDARIFVEEVWNMSQQVAAAKVQQLPVPCQRSIQYRYLERFLKIFRTFMKDIWNMLSNLEYQQIVRASFK